MPHSPSFPTPSFKQKDWRAPRRSVSALARLLRRAIGARSSIPASIPALLSAPWSRKPALPAICWRLSRYRYHLFPIKRRLPHWRYMCSEFLWKPLNTRKFVAC